MTTQTFINIGVEQRLAERLAEFGITAPSPVQESAIPAVLEGCDVLAQSQTGTGKTLAYLLPVLQRIDPERKVMQALILAPTQELAMQILRESQRYAEGTGIEAQALIGGAAIGRQVERLKRHPQLVVGTPGRVRELLASRKLKLHETRMLVVDEVDQLFQLGGAGDVDQILKASLRDRQLLFLSATVTDEIRSLAAREMKDPVEIGIEPEQRTSATLEHLYFVCEQRDKIDLVRRIIRTYDVPKVLVFVNQIDSIGEVEAKLNYVGLNAGALYGDADKTTRSLTLRRFREGEYRVLVASDVAARGLDIEQLGMVIHLDPATDSENYVHRAGRTGRMGRKGLSISIVAPQETFIIRKFARELGISFGLRGLAGGRITTPKEEARPFRREVKPLRDPDTENRGRRGESGTRGLSGRGGDTEGYRGSERGSDTGRGAARPKPSSARKAGAKTSAVKPAGERKLDRHRDRKNKGAPKWLKNKPPRD
ncbi:DEAD/DEAH box helicase [Paenibacillus physcomitrellae]|uniref:DEAD-box ATP-dependent RNA helicase CshC n=1 Tax=Paenibacillus physcomitrellae TaxID=1619311 RepID=A0ABQ1G1I1_9BACL|nr:DEAD/DEAH box helicase [Paenibacillus physcomitrellae]GGA35664.1 DEAD-box ATP-dependent RNA helicase CshC [Paenibacillus physcomitrellae]